MDKIQCPKCKAKHSFWKWAYWRDLFGGTNQCPNCKSLFYLKIKTHPFFDKRIFTVLCAVLLAGGVTAIVGISIILLLEAVFDDKLLILVILILTIYPASFYIVGYLAAMIINKFCIFEHKKT